MVIAAGVVSGLIASPIVTGASTPGWSRLLAAVGGETAFGYPPFATYGYQHVWSYTLVNLWSGLLIMHLLSGGRLSAVFSARPLVYTGTISYGLYVFHYPVLALLKAAVFFHPYSLEGLVMFAIYLASVFAVAALSFRYFERWFLVWKDRRFVRRRPSPAVQNPLIT